MTDSLRRFERTDVRQPSVLRSPVPSAESGEDAAAEEDDASPDAPRSSDHLHLPRVKLVLLPFRSGEPVSTHPELAAYLAEGWRILRAEPRVTEEGTRLMVVLG